MSGMEPSLRSSCFCGAVSPLIRSDIGRRSYAFHRLPPQDLRLSIVKLDGSCFEVQVERTGTVAELKEAVEEVFSQFPKNRESKISWSHVWGHFCLCFEGQKLVDEKAYIRQFGIKDGDQLHFINHVSVKFDPE